MTDDKKKLIVVGVLALVVVCVGAFQFMGGGSTPPPPPAEAPKETAKKKEEESVFKTVTPPKNPYVAFELSPRDPFKPVELEPIQTSAPPQPVGGASVPAQRIPKPQPEIQISPGSGFNAGFEPVTVQAPEPTFAYTLSGVMLGAKPMAVFSDGQGNQRLVMLSGSLDPDTQVISIEKNTVAVRFHGKTLRLTVEGTPNAK